MKTFIRLHVYLNTWDSTLYKKCTKLSVINVLECTLVSHFLLSSNFHSLYWLYTVYIVLKSSVKIKNILKIVHLHTFYSLCKSLPCKNWTKKKCLMRVTFDRFSHFELLPTSTRYAKLQNTHLIRCIVPPGNTSHNKKPSKCLQSASAICTSLWSSFKAICLMRRLLRNLWVRCGRATALLTLLPLCDHENPAVSALTTGANCAAFLWCWMTHSTKYRTCTHT